jgi:lysozyme
MNNKKIYKISEKGILLIKNFEGLRLKAYQCSGSVWTIGWGTTFINGVKVKSGDIIDLEMAKKLFRMDIEKHEAIVNSKLQISLNQNQFDALVSHTFNTGGSDTLFELINSQSSSLKILHWIKNTYITTGGNLILGLVKRRQKEANLFYEPIV